MTHERTPQTNRQKTDDDPLQILVVNPFLLELEPEQPGKLVALEGDTETVETQLKLLPPSQTILILPALQDSLSKDLDKDVFNARAFIHSVHTGFTERNETARAFLRPSTSKQPRLVFIAGGSVSARATCIAKISENTTNGDIIEAETIFNEIVKDGVAGLMKQDVMNGEDKAKAGEDGEGGKVENGIEDPSTRAMKAADSLDRATERLEQEDPTGDVAAPGLEGTVDSHAMGDSHSLLDGAVSEKRTEVADSTSLSGEARPTGQKGDDIVSTVVTVPNQSRRFTIEEKRTTFGPRYSISTSAPASVLGAIQSTEKIEEDEGYDDPDFTSPGDESMISVPPTPTVVYEEAYLVDVQSGSPTKAVKRAQSVPRFYRSNSDILEPSSSPKPLKHTTSDYNLRRPPGRRFNSYPTLPRTTFVKASQTTIRKSPTLRTSTRSNSSSSQDAPPRVYVDRGEDALHISEEQLVEPFTPVFPIIEDMIIHLIDDTSNKILESVIRSYKNGSYPVIPTTAVSSSSDFEQKVSTSPVAVVNGQQVEAVRPESYLTAETDDIGYERRHEYDPYADEDRYPPDIKRQWPSMPKTMQLDSIDSSVGPPTPTFTRPPSQDNGVTEKFIDFTPTNPNNAINVQNSFRQLLSLHFPAGENGYSQYDYPIATEVDRLWKPVFRNDQNTSFGNDSRNVDQIIALGCEDGVKKDFFFQVSGQVERLGTKKDGVNKSGKIDIRYLIANVMQHLSRFSLPSQESFNPLSNPKALAAHLVPQIESYLAINTSTRLLILQYPASHLPTIFALRKLLGSDLLKVAGILDSLASDPPSMSRPRKSNPLSNEAVSQRAETHILLDSLQRTHADNTRADSLATLEGQASSAGSVRSSLANKSSITASFARADYLLPSTATDVEITTFLSSIWKSLMEKSAFYTPEPEPKPIIIERPPMPPPPTPNGSSRDIRRERDRLERERDKYRDNDRDTEQDSIYRSSFRKGVSGTQSKISRLTGGAATGPSAPRSPYAASIISTSTARPSIRHRERDRDTDYDPSIASTTHTRQKYTASIASTKTTNSEKERRRDREWENFYIGDEDSEDDEYDRMIMGRAGQRIMPEPEVEMKTQKRDKRKALKWLGLA
ncbi:hypothetical protein EG329_008408 [Mollisiaceae sp. DMI_Dod_QoI]|nr:hypothetical protein EG329_008408 [Helotiales sp. DMI_Dod_QoI]